MGGVEPGARYLNPTLKHLFRICVKTYRLQEHDAYILVRGCQLLLLLIHPLQTLKMAEIDQNSIRNKTPTHRQTVSLAYHDGRQMNASSSHQNSASTSPKHDTRPQTTAAPIPPLRHITLPDIVYAFEHEVFASINLVNSYLTRIRKMDREFHSISEVSSSAIASAEALDTERLVKGKRGPLHGVPVLIKDNKSILDDGTETACGSMALGKFSI
jgi:hypothetical protein